MTKIAEGISIAWLKGRIGVSLCLWGYFLPRFGIPIGKSLASRNVGFFHDDSQTTSENSGIRK